MVMAFLQWHTQITSKQKNEIQIFFLLIWTPKISIFAFDNDGL